MADPFIAEIRVVGFNFPPTGWAFCDGQLIPISQNTALFALLGTNYGGNGKTNFALPDLQERAPMMPGQGPGLSDRFLGEVGGSESVTLLESEIPSHTHVVSATGSLASASLAATNHALARSTGGFVYDPTPTGPSTVMAGEVISPAGGDQPHNNLMPYLTMNFVIALQGVFPQRG